MASVFESVDHSGALPAKIFITQIDQCTFHWHDDYEIVLVLKGAVTIYCGAIPTLLTAGEYFLFNSKTVHGLQRTAEDNLCLCIQFRPKILASELGDQQFFYHFYFNSLAEEYRPQKPYQYFVNDMIELAMASQQKTDAATLRTYAKLLHLVADLVEYVPCDIRRLPVGQSDDPPMDTYNKILHYISQNLQSENLNDELCRYLGMSGKSLYRYLKTTLGLTLKELYDITRVETACAMLRENRKSMAAIWQFCGFSSEVSFYRNFKKQIGLTPNEYRKRNRGSGHSSLGESYAGFNLGEATELMEAFIEANRVGMEG